MLFLLSNVGNKYLFSKSCYLIIILYICRIKLFKIMKTIKFKAWDLVKKEWFCHSFYVHESGTRIVDCNEFHHAIGTEVIVI